MRKGGRLFIVLGVALALVAAVLAILVFSNGLGSKQQANQPAKATVVVAARDVQANTVLTQADVELTQVDKSVVAPGAATSVGQVVGYASAGNLKKGQYIVSGNLTTAGLNLDLANGKRAIALPVDRVNALGGMIQANDHIDLIYSTRIKLTRVLPTEPIEVTDATKGYANEDTLKLPVPPTGAGSNTYPYPGEPGSRFLVTDNADGNPTTKIVIQNVRVLRVIAGDVTVDQTTSATTASTNQSASSPNSNTATPQTAADKLPNSDLLVLEVDPQQAEVIKFLEDNDGRYQVALRAKDDNGSATTTGVTYDQLVSQYGLPVPKSVRMPGGGQ